MTALADDDGARTSRIAVDEELPGRVTIPYVLLKQINPTKIIGYKGINYEQNTRSSKLLL